jgi:hypothetical protein
LPEKNEQARTIVRVEQNYLKKMREHAHAHAMLTIVSKFGVGVDDSVLWLSFAQQKRVSEKSLKKLFC